MTTLAQQTAPAKPAPVAAPTAAASAAPVPVAASPRRGSTVRRVLCQAPPTVWAYFDFVLVAAVTWGAHSLLVFGHSGYRWVAGPLLSGVTFAACLTFAGLVFGLHERKTLAARSRILVRLMMTLALGLILAHACIYLFFYGATTRWLGVLVALLYSAVALPVRLAAHAAITSSRRRVLCVGRGDSVRKVVALLDHALRPHVQIVGHVHVAAPATAQTAAPASRTRFVADADTEFERACPCLGGLDEIDAVLRRHAVDEIIVGAELSADREVGRAMLTCLDRRCRVTDQPTFVEKLLGEVPTEDIDAQWFLAADVQSGGGYDTAKRMLDVVAALLGLVLTLPLWPWIALGIRLDSRGPVFFRQRRVGLHGREFTIYKFRTMRVDAERQGARWADKNDARATRFGRFLRLSRLDELPQLWNILHGEMSLVGPRPERPEFTEQLAWVIPHYRQRHLIKPGLTGWAQIHYGYGASVEDARRKLCFDLYYLKHRSIDLDAAIIIRTIGRFILGSR